jgi:hypothetical protein
VDELDTSGGASQPVGWRRVSLAFVVCSALAFGLLGCSVYDDGVLESTSSGPTGGGGGAAGTAAGSGAGTGGRTSPPQSGSGGQAGGAGTGAITSGSGGSCAAGAGCQDQCPSDPAKTVPGACGCGMSETDGDDDDTPDCVDDCDEDPDKKTPGVCGCGTADLDGDKDGTSDCVDECASDAEKTEPGACGCGVVDSQDDSDSDGTVDCVDACPQDMLKTEPLMCGCGMAETDTDRDGTADCMDTCPSDPLKTAPGGCGCGIPDADSGAVVGCLGLKNALVRRYMFEGTGTSVVDAKGGEAGTLAGGAALSGGGAVLNADGEHVVLPDGIVSGLTNATIEMWVTWTGLGNPWQRLFDFGSSSSGSGTSYLFLTAKAAAPDEVMMLVYRAANDSAEVRVQSTRSLPINVQAHVAVVVDDTNNKLSFYLNTTLEGTATFTKQLSGIMDVNDWLGRSQYSTDPELNGTIHELRIYNTALTPEQLNFSLTNGLDPGYLTGG